MAKQDPNLLLNQKYTVLNVTFHQAQHQTDSNEVSLLTQIENLLSEEKSWDCANQVELLLASLLHGEELDQLVLNKLLKVQGLDTIEADHFKKQFESAKSDQARQVILKQLIQFLQLEEIRLRLRHTYSSKAWYFTSYAFIATFILFFLPYFFPPILDYLYNLGSGEGRAIDIFTAVTSGAMGAGFSMLTGLKGRISKSSLSGLQLLQRKSYILSKIITGFGAGLIFFYFLQSGLLSGEAFPDYSNQTSSLSENTTLDVRSLALLVIWCFLSGFSEKLVPAVLAKTEGKLKENTAELDESS